MNTRTLGTVMAAVLAAACAAEAACTRIDERGLRSAFTNAPQLEFVGFYSLGYVGLRGCNNAFANCRQLETADFSSVTNAADYAFYAAFSNCVSLKNASFDELEKCGFMAFRSAFSGCTNLHGVTFPKLRKVGGTAFFGVGADLSLPSLTEVDNGTFDMVDSRSISIPAVTSVTHYAFHSRPPCTNLVLSAMSTNEVNATMAWDGEDPFWYPCWGLQSGCVIHCKDGDITVP